MNNTVDEIKVMLDKLNSELENLRAENHELKLRLSKYESVVTNSATDDLMLEDVIQIIDKCTLTRPKYRYHSGFRRLIDKGYRTLGDCRELSLYDIINLPQVGPEAAAIVIVALEHFDIIKVEDFCISKVTKSHQNYNNFMNLIAKYREAIHF